MKKLSRARDEIIVLFFVKRERREGKEKKKFGRISIWGRIYEEGGGGRGEIGGEQARWKKRGEGGEGAL